MPATRALPLLGTVSSSEGFQRFGVLAVACLGVVLVQCGVASVFVALPAIASQLHASQSQLQWIADAYTVILASLLFFFGALGDRYGRRRILLIGLVVYASTSAVAAEAGSPTELIAVRAFMGVGAALIFPVTLTILTTTFPADKRSQASAVWTVATTTGGLIGFVGAGACLEFWWWGSLFVLTIVMSGVCLLLAVVFLPTQEDLRPVRLDPGGAPIATAAVGVLVYATIEAPIRGWLGGFTIGAMVVGVIYAAVFIGFEHLTPVPMLDPKTFAQRSVTAGTLLLIVQFMAIFGFMLLDFQYFQYFQYLRGASALVTGMAAAALIGVGGVIAVPIAHRVNQTGHLRTGVALGTVLSSLGCLVFASLGQHSGYLWIAVSVVLVGAGAGMSSVIGTKAITEGLPYYKQGVASALNDTTREFGAALGVAVPGAILDSVYRSTIGHTAAYRQLSSGGAAQVSTLA